MEPKKNPKVDINKRKGLYLEIGLVVSLALIIGAFSISQREKEIDLSGLGQDVAEMEMIEVTTETTPPPQEVQQQTINVISDIIEVVRNDTQIDTRFDFADDFSDDIELVQVAVEMEEVEEEAPVFIAEQMPTFQGGDINVAFRNWVNQRLVYPQVASENGIQGMVVLQFVVEKDGSVSNVRAVRSPDKLLADEAVRVVKMSPKWSPARQRNLPVRLMYTWNIEFILQ